MKKKIVVCILAVMTGVMLCGCHFSFGNIEDHNADEQHYGLGEEKETEETEEEKTKEEEDTSEPETESEQESETEEEQNNLASPIAHGAGHNGKPTLGGSGNSSRPSTTNESDYDQDAVEAYQAFLEGDMAFAVTSNYAKLVKNKVVTCKAAFEKNEEYDFATLEDIIQTDYIEDRGWSNDYDSVEYAYLDCGRDDVPELAVRFKGLDIEAPDDNSTLTCIFTYQDGALELSYAVDNWSRSDTVIYKYGFMEHEGSNGADDYYMGGGYIDAQGEYCVLYDMETLYGQGMSALDKDAYNNAFSNSDDPEALINICEVDGITYYQYGYDDTDYDDEMQAFIEQCEADGITFSDKDEVNTAVAKLCVFHDMEAEDLEGDELAWKTV